MSTTITSVALPRRNATAAEATAAGYPWTTVKHITHSGQTLYFVRHKQTGNVYARNPEAEAEDGSDAALLDEFKGRWIDGALDEYADELTDAKIEEIMAPVDACPMPEAVPVEAAEVSDSDSDSDSAAPAPAEEAEEAEEAESEDEEAAPAAPAPVEMSAQEAAEMLWQRLSEEERHSVFVQMAVALPRRYTPKAKGDKAPAKPRAKADKSLPIHAKEQYCAPVSDKPYRIAYAGGDRAVLTKLVHGEVLYRRRADGVFDVARVHVYRDHEHQIMDHLQYHYQEKPGSELKVFKSCSQFSNFCLAKQRAELGGTGKQGGTTKPTECGPKRCFVVRDGQIVYLANL